MFTISKQFVFTDLEIPLPQMNIYPVDELFDSTSSLYPVAVIFYDKVKALYRKMGPRKNGDDSFLHPINVVYSLKSRGVTNQTTLLCGLLHDYIEELVDIYRDEQGINDKEDHGKRLLDAYEIRLVAAFEKELMNLVLEHKLEKDFPSKVCSVLSLLTRHKRHFYYKSLSFMFTSSEYDISVREQAIQIKLADRIHNIQSIGSFDSLGQLYQCFKNFFILNNAKYFLIHRYGKDVFRTDRKAKNPEATERLFNRCAKATYLAYLRICQDAESRMTSNVQWILQLAFKKFTLEYEGIWEVTDLDDTWHHPMRLYFGVVRKFDARLHQEWGLFERHKELEWQFTTSFFKNLKMTDDELKALLDYKDAYSLKEVIAYLIYQDDYVLKTFLAEELTSTGRIRKGKLRKRI